MKFIYSLIVLLFGSSLLSAQSNLDYKIGAYFGVGVNIHNADFYKLAGIPNCCPKFESGNGIGFNAGVLYEHKYNGKVWLAARLGVMNLYGKLINEEETTIITSSGPSKGAFEHRLEGSFFNIGFEPRIVYNPLASLFANVGLRLSTNTSSTYKQIEVLTKPSGAGTFVDEFGNDTGLRTRNKYSGDIPEATSFQMFITGGLSYELPLNKSKSLLLAPEVNYYFPITELAKNTDWKANVLHFGLAIKYNPEKPRENYYKKEYKIDTVQIKSDAIASITFKSGSDRTSSRKVEESDKIINIETISRTDTLFSPIVYSLTATVAAVGVDENGSEIPNPTFKIEEFVSNRLYPLLNYIFFDENSSDIPSRYNAIPASETKNFQIINLYRDSTLQIYHNTLNVIGLRLKENTSAKITLVGCNSDVSTEKGNFELSKKRAEAIKDYLVGVWGIEGSRISTQARNLPQKASTPINETDKMAENRRVEIISESYNILEPIFIEKIDRSSNPPIIRFKPTVYSEAGLSSWELIAYQYSEQENHYKTSGGESLPSQIDWELSQYQNIIPKAAEPVLAELKLVDKKNNQTVASAKTPDIDVITIQEKRKEMQGDYEIEKFSLILFDFDKSTIDGANKKIIDFIKQRIRKESEIEIIGYTDRTGTSEYNLRLSEDRANSAKIALGNIEAQAKGVGSTILLYDNEFPEGRFYCRTVDIVIKTKVK